MGFMLRSDDMAFCEMYLQKEAAFDAVAELGELGCVQFLDMTPTLAAFQRRFIPEMCRCVEMERKLTYIKSEMDKDQIHVPLIEGKEPYALKIPSYNTYETQLEKWENDIQEMSAYHNKLLTNYQQLFELYYVLSHIGPMLGEVEFRRESWFKSASGEPTFGSGLRLTVLTGVVRRSKCYALELMLWRISRGNVFIKLAKEDKLFEDPSVNMMVRKVAFMVICQGEQVQIRVRKICTAFYANLYPCPMSYEEREETINKLDTRLKDLDQVIKKTKYYRCKALRTMSRSWHKWVVEIRKAKAVYIIMNLFNLDYTRNCLIGQCWVPERDLKQVVTLLDQCSDKLSPNVASFISKVKTALPPPTFHRTNKFTRGFQALINAYGDSTYREINPGLFTLITFPFLFAIMFGDTGHGMLVFSFSLWMVLNEKKLIAQRSTNEIWNIFFGGRYVILLMSMFTMYTGLVYNDVFSKPLALFKSQWENHYTSAEIAIATEQAHLSLDPAEIDRNTYPFGVDPVWAIAQNKIMFDNSLKMKLSIILGVIHMLFGLLLSFCNHIYFKHTYAVFLEFIPQFVFLCCLFVWLVFLIYFKWLLYSPRSDDIKRRPGCAPLILIHFIDMCLMRTTKTLDPNCKAYMFNQQHIIQKVLLIVGLCCVPILLFGSPIYLLSTRKRNAKVDQTLKKFKKLKDMNRSSSGYVGSSLAAITMGATETEDSNNPGFGELMIHQGVHTIEFVLSTVSHTASYLRLWALSLAHAQLSDMLWTMILSKLALRDYSYVGVAKLFFIFAIWAMFTLSILVVMEGLSAFLHTLRLHWVEFMSKFFLGGGVKFVPFTFKNVLQEEVKDETEGACKKRVEVTGDTL